MVGVIIPALNEEASIGGVLDRLPRGVRPIVVDNGSNDHTAEIARSRGATVIFEGHRGYGSACLAGLAELDRDPPEIVAFLDADLSDDPENLERLVRPLSENVADFTIASRKPDSGAQPWHARAGNQFATSLMGLLYGARYRDLGPFRALRWEALKKLKMRDRDFGWTAEMQVKAVRFKLRVIEIDLPYRRRVGRSKISGTWSGSIRAGTKIIWTVIKYRFVPASYF